MKTTWLILFVFSVICASAQQWQNKVDSVVIVNRQVREYSHGNLNFKVRGYVVPFDANNNLSLGFNNTVSGVQNYLEGDWISLVNSNSNMVQANHAHIANSNGGAFFGADHGTNIPCSEDYGFVANDANENHGASGSVFGFGNVNWDENGYCGGSECINGTPGMPNADYSTFCFGYRAWNRGDCSQTQGTYVKTLADYAMTWGFGVHGQNIYSINTEDGVLSWVNNSDRPSLKLYPANGVGTYSTFEIKGSVKNLPPEFADNASAYAALGDSMYYRSWDGQRWQVCVTTESPAFMIQQQEDLTVKSITSADALKLNGTWYNVNGQAVVKPTTGIYYFIESKY